ncbi:MAG TPA: hypothetical protein VLA89_19015 [Gemmatimonadales bacterium]|nr:hypothetical protein [Gemmatimonadales bacterium]
MEQSRALGVPKPHPQTHAVDGQSAVMPTSVHNAPVGTDSRTPKRVLWLNGLMVGIGGVVGMAGVDRLVFTVDSFAYVLAYLGLVLAIQIALLFCVKRRTGAPPG